MATDYDKSHWQLNKDSISLTIERSYHLEYRRKTPFTSGSENGIMTPGIEAI